MPSEASPPAPTNIDASVMTVKSKSLDFGREKYEKGTPILFAMIEQSMSTCNRERKIAEVRIAGPRPSFDVRFEYGINDSSPRAKACNGR